MMTKEPIYLDYNATTPLLPEVFEAMVPYLREHFGNPSSDHVYGRTARSAVAQARTHVSELIGCDASEIIFTSGGTEASNLAIYGVMGARPQRTRIVTSVIEHPATRQPCAGLRQNGHAVELLAVDSGGRIVVDQARAAIGAQTALVTVMHANNETGVLQPVRELAAISHDAGALLHTDAAQSLGKVPVRVDELGADLMTVAGHKLYGPKGVGALYVRRGIRIVPFARGAGHERGLRPGTENVASIVGFGAACRVAGQDLDREAMRIQKLRDGLFESLRADIPDLRLNGHPTLRLPNTLSVRFPNVSGRAVLTNAPEILASMGSACHEGHEQPSSVITSMGVSAEDALGTVRLTLGRSTTEPDVMRASAALRGAYRKTLRDAS